MISYPAGFTGNWNNGTIAAGGSQNITVTFAPTAAQSYGGTLTVNSDKTDGTNTTSISGTGFISTYTISGYVRDSANNLGMSGVTLTFGNGGGTASTDSSGNYSKTVSSGWSGTVTPSKNGYTFNPANGSYSNVTANQTGQNYIGTIANTSKSIPGDIDILSKVINCDFQNLIKTVFFSVVFYCVARV